MARDRRQRSKAGARPIVANQTRMVVLAAAVVLVVLMMFDDSEGPGIGQSLIILAFFINKDNA